MDLLFAATLLAVIGFTLPAKKHLRYGAAIAALLVVLAVFQSTGGRGTLGLSSTYIVVAAVALVAILSLRRQNLPWLFLPFAIHIGFGLAVIWDRQDGQINAALNLLFGALAWAAGSLAGGAYRRDARIERWVVLILLLIVAFELAVCAAQFVGIDVFSVEGRTSELEGGRSNGTYSHPSTVGKIMTLVLVLLLPSTRSEDRWSARLASIAVVASLLPILMSMSRANLVAAAAMILVWSLAQPQVGFSLKRFALPAAGGLVVLVFLDQILARFDQSTGERDHFMTVALEQLSRTPWTGVGPGSYVAVVGRFDALTAQGWPVHNIFVLQAVELGIIGGLLFFLPFLVVAMTAVRRWRAADAEGGAFARSMLAYIPGLAAIGWTGWGWLAPDTLLLACFVFAFVQQQLRPDRVPGSPDLVVPGPRRRLRLA